MLKTLPIISTTLIPLEVQAGVAVTVAHGLGRQVGGWLVVWQSAPVNFHVVDPKADTANQLILMPSASAAVRLVLL